MQRAKLAIDDERDRAVFDDIQHAIELYRDRAPGFEFVTCLCVMVKFQGMIFDEPYGLPAEETIARAEFRERLLRCQARRA